MSDDSNYPFIVTSPIGDPLAMISQDEVVKAGALLRFILIKGWPARRHSTRYVQLDTRRANDHHARTHGPRLTFRGVAHPPAPIRSQTASRPAPRCAQGSGVFDFHRTFSEIGPVR